MEQTLTLHGPRCPFCHEDVARGQELEVCASCHAFHHAACFSESGGCAACRLAIPNAPRPPAPRRRTWWRELVVGIGLVVLVILIVTEGAGCRLDVKDLVSTNTFERELRTQPVDVLGLSMRTPSWLGQTATPGLLAGGGFELEVARWALPEWRGKPAIPLLSSRGVALDTWTGRGDFFEGAIGCVFQSDTSPGHETGSTVVAWITFENERVRIEARGPEGKTAQLLRAIVGTLRLPKGQPIPSTRSFAELEERTIEGVAVQAPTGVGERFSLEVNVAGAANALPLSELIVLTKQQQPGSLLLEDRNRSKLLPWWGLFLVPSRREGEIVVPERLALVGVGTEQHGIIVTASMPAGATWEEARERLEKQLSSVGVARDRAFPTPSNAPTVLGGWKVPRPAGWEEQSINYPNTGLRWTSLEGDEIDVFLIEFPSDRQRVVLTSSVITGSTMPENGALPYLIFLGRPGKGRDPGALRVLVHELEASAGRIGE